MGSDDGHGPHANKADAPLIPCGSGGEDLPGHPNFPSTPKGVAKAVQTEAPSSYAIAGKVMFAAAGAFAGILLALIALHLYNSGRRRYSRDRRRLLRSLANISSGGAAAPDSPRARGLDPAVLRALPVVVAAASSSSSSGGVGGGDDCAVCLAEFEQGEEARALPRCGHRFHVECIDAWFRGNSTCPLCRADVQAPAPVPGTDDAEARPAEEVRIDVVAGDAAAKGGAPAMPSDGSSRRPDPHPLPSEP